MGRRRVRRTFPWRQRRGKNWHTAAATAVAEPCTTGHRGGGGIAGDSLLYAWHGMAGMAGRHGMAGVCERVNGRRTRYAMSKQPAGSPCRPRPPPWRAPSRGAPGSVCQPQRTLPPEMSRAFAPCWPAGAAAAEAAAAVGFWKAAVPSLRTARHAPCRFWQEASGVRTRWAGEKRRKQPAQIRRGVTCGWRGARDMVTTPPPDLHRVG